MIHFSKDNPFVFIWNIKFGTFYCKSQISSPTFKTHIHGEEEWNLYYYPKMEDGIFDRLVLKRGLTDKSRELVAVNYRMEVIEHHLHSGESQGNFNKGGYVSWEFSKNNFEMFGNLSSVSPHGLTIQLFVWGFSTENEISRILGRTEVEEESASVLWKISGFKSSILENKMVSLPTSSAYRLSFEMNEGENAKLIFTQIMCSCEAPSYLNADVFRLDSIGHRYHLLKAEYQFDRSTKTVKISPFIKRDQMRGENSSLLENDVLTLHVKLTAPTGGSRDGIVEYQYGAPLPEEVFETENILMHPKRKSFSALQRDFSSLYSNRIVTDVIVRIGEKSLQAHKCVLVSRSPVFSAMFKQQMLENVNNLVDIHDIDYDTFDILLRFLYDAKLPNLDIEIAKDLMIASDKYQILSLKEECSEFLKSNINEGSVCEILVLSDLLNDEELKSAAVAFIRPIKKGFLKSAEWKELTRNNRILATEVLTCLVMDE